MSTSKSHNKVNLMSNQHSTLFNVHTTRHKAILQVSILILLFLLSSSVANALNERYIFVVAYIIAFVITAWHLYRYHIQKDHDRAAQRILMILSVLFFSFFIIGQHRTFDVLWLLTIPVIVVMISDYQKIKRWIVVFNLLILSATILQYFMPYIIAYEGFALWSLLWASIFISGMALHYKKVEYQLQNELKSYHEDLEQKVATSVDEIQTLRTQKAQADLHLLQSRLKSLETQLNPHFLFNALNSIAELIHQDSDQAEDAILRVSAFLRNTMKESTLQTFNSELNNVIDYVALENIRFANKIVLHLPQNIPAWDVPKFSIQLLVENAIKHGFDTQKEALNITISTSNTHKTIIVSNDGRPMSSTHLGIGLGNLNERLALLCDGSLTIVDITLPTFHINLGACNEHFDRR